MRSDEIRSSFREFFAARDHAVVPSASLVPSSLDASVLLTTAGMQPFKPYFLGLETPPAPRVTSVQKCFRSTDIDEVGATARHLTLFEMMGNFSFGDYFKEGAVGYAWELVTQGWRMDEARVWASVFAGEEGVPADEEAVALWLDVGVPAERIVRLGREHNFWQAGPTGPCGPCSELYYDRGAEHGCGRPVGTAPTETTCAPGCDCDRFLEFWNLVFMQYDRAEDGTLSPLPRPSIDTGSGVERVAALLQDVHSVYETDGFVALISALEGWSGARYVNGGGETKALRVLCDHGRAMTMLAADGVTPSNEGRGYILRRVVRRAVIQGRQIGLATPFLARLQGLVVDQLGAAYPELETQRAEVAALLTAEEERFARTLETGLALLDDVIARVRSTGGVEIPAADAFRLHDTHGFPVEVTAEIAAGHDLALDEAGFAVLMEEQRTRARTAGRRGAGSLRERAGAFAREAGFVTEFVGYDRLDVETTADAVEPVDEGRLLVKLRTSPFYAEGGGQVADTGSIEWGGGRAAVDEVFRFDADQALLVTPERGTLAGGEPVRARVAADRRRPTVANHTGTHLLHRALQRRLGDHVRQRGSAVRPDKLRFDFSHGEPLTAAELQDVEDEVNRLVVETRPVRIFETDQDEARRLGATMLFGEKYGDVVRVVEIDDYSRELCGGTHARSTAEVGPFKIVHESSVGQGVRRIEALTGAAALDLLRSRERAAAAVARDLRTEPEGLPDAVARLRTRIRELEAAARAGGGDGAAGVSLQALLDQAERHGPISVLVAEAGETPPGDLRGLSDRLRGKLGGSVVLLASRAGGRAHLVAGATPEAVAAGVSAADVIGAAAPLVGGGGGGRPTMAQAGGKDPDRLPEALTAARDYIAGRLDG
ncbi:MAG: Alanyl-tRNA synthetase [uncultured Thermoleophilia bacterium]|uniref:Alanine--tRNA ligase n=1 Tax=uncultured Thermoleophilia bacterium TaxID=1497501 RepID=A0A6J4TS58_9ACTN|nr:MAG: Alanyl-tRNA synthetase [uncultured Thermoleophilia bacterium]